MKKKLCILLIAALLVPLNFSLSEGTASATRYAQGPNRHYGVKGWVGYNSDYVFYINDNALIRIDESGTETVLYTGSISCLLDCDEQYVYILWHWMDEKEFRSDEGELSGLTTAGLRVDCRTGQTSEIPQDFYDQRRIVDYLDGEPHQLPNGNTVVYTWSNLWERNDWALNITRVDGTQRKLTGASYAGNFDITDRYIFVWSDDESWDENDWATWTTSLIRYDLNGENPYPIPGLQNRYYTNIIPIGDSIYYAESQDEYDENFDWMTADNLGNVRITQLDMDGNVIARTHHAGSPSNGTGDIISVKDWLFIYDTTAGYGIWAEYCDKVQITTTSNNSLAPPGKGECPESAICGAQIALTWGAVSGATSYVLRWSFNGVDQPQMTGLKESKAVLTMPSTPGYAYINIYAVNDTGTWVQSIPLEYVIEVLPSAEEMRVFLENYMLYYRYKKLTIGGEIGLDKAITAFFKVNSNTSDVFGILKNGETLAKLLTNFGVNEGNLTSFLSTVGNGLEFDDSIFKVTGEVGFAKKFLELVLIQHDLEMIESYLLSGRLLINDDNPKNDVLKYVKWYKDTADTAFYLVIADKAILALINEGAKTGEPFMVFFKYFVKVASSFTGGTPSQKTVDEVKDAYETLCNYLIKYARIDAFANNNPYLMVKIACPVDVTIYRNNAVVLSSAALITESTIGSLAFLGDNGDVKAVTLYEEVDYQIELTGMDTGKMDLTLYFPQISELREFKQVPIVPGMVMTTEASSRADTLLHIDRNGDGTFEETLFASVSLTASERSERSNAETQQNFVIGSGTNTTLILAIASGVLALSMLTAFLVIVFKQKRINRARREYYAAYAANTQNRQRTPRYPDHQSTGSTLPPSKPSDYPPMSRQPRRRLIQEDDWRNHDS